jgi:hypothetical protein
MRSHIPLVALTSILLLVGCAAPGARPDADDGGDLFDDPAATAEPTESPETEAPVDPCAVFTKSDAEALAGTPLQDGVASGNPDQAMCMYTAPPEGSVAQAEIGIGDGAKKFYDIEVQLGHTFEAVPGIADEAYLEAEQSTIFFVSDGTWVSIRLVRLNDPAENVEPLKLAATTVASRL